VTRFRRRPCGAEAKRSPGERARSGSFSLSRAPNGAKAYSLGREPQDGCGSRSTRGSCGFRRRLYAFPSPDRGEGVQPGARAPGRVRFPIDTMFLGFSPQALRRRPCGAEAKRSPGERARSGSFSPSRAPTGAKASSLGREPQDGCGSRSARGSWGFRPRLYAAAPAGLSRTDHLESEQTLLKGRTEKPACHALLPRVPLYSMGAPCYARPCGHVTLVRGGSGSKCHRSQDSSGPLAVDNLMRSGHEPRSRYVPFARVARPGGAVCRPRVAAGFQQGSRVGSLDKAKRRSVPFRAHSRDLNSGSSRGRLP
jgi:hypothetical protein